MALTLRDPSLGERDAQDALQPESKQWAKLGEKAAEHQVGWVLRVCGVRWGCMMCGVC